MNKLLFLLCALAHAYDGYAQIQTPMFQMPLWFEDAVGNRDTLIVGYDTSASAQVINPQFGEVLLTTPFDSVFEVRAIHADDPTYSQMSKTLIENYEWTFGVQCGVGGGMLIMIRAKYLPVTIRWERTTIGLNPCHNNTILSPDELIWIFPNWWDARIFYCMANDSSVTTDFNYSAYPPPDFWLEHPFEVEGLGQQTLPGFYLVFRYDWYCQTLPAHEAAETAPLLAYPNPVMTDEVFLRIPDGHIFTKLDLVDALGRTVRSARGSFTDMTTFDVSGVPAGVYYLLAQGEGSAGRVVKLQRW